MEEVLLSLIALFIFILMCRELACWYWKINDINTVLKEIRDLLKEQKVEVTQLEKESNANAEQP